MVVIYGYSDDLIEVKVGGEEEEFGVYSDQNFKGRVIVGCLISVEAFYSDCWRFAIGQKSEDAGPIPPWSIRVMQQPDSGYSARVEIDAPEGTAVEFHHAKRGGNGGEGDVYTFGKGWS